MDRSPGSTASTFFRQLIQSRDITQQLVNHDQEIKVAIIDDDFHFALQSDGGEKLHVKLHDGMFTLSLGPCSDESVTLVAPEAEWQKFFSPLPPPPYQSFWGMLRVLGHDGRIRVGGDPASFAKNARVWRLVLDKMKQVFNDKNTGPPNTNLEEEPEVDAVVGRYVWINSEYFGKCKMFVESSGNGQQALLLLHTAGADSRQYHSIMNDKELQKRTTMFAFDMPGHGRSYPGHKMIISQLGIKDCIVSGASMAGHVCLAVALRATELGVVGVIPCEACDYVSSSGTLYGIASSNNESVMNAEIVSGLSGPSTLPAHQKMIWWGYSSQAAGIFAGDLCFYFEGWDGRDRVASIDTTICPVYMLTGEYDYSCTPAASRATAAKIPGAVFTEMKGMGHFPAAEDPSGFLPHLFRGLDFIQNASVKR
ncbi:uncharacterized protein AB675_3722 [Cyphellophora attinorum]|uniref:AB hydrolase-1 domain-containing protein n=1 Tax=Cyphellophora attinorum TaxID=1664694 RepID=A0A0N0NJP2_9EURO|nr:uncharacterized protein AB675_3722 [Phialophora attinorum]KPI37118.1 hypothetical protein AB675_3722 [Phialophora attinorum]